MKAQRLAAALLTAGIAALAPAANGQELGSPPWVTKPIVLDPELLGQEPAAALTVDTHNRLQVQAFFHWVYEASAGVAMEWNGSVTQCLPGTTSPAYAEATIRRVNYYRAMTGLPGDVTLDPEWNRKCQAAALMMSAQGELSHSPDPSWACYSEDGKEAAGYSNLAGGAAGPDAIAGYMDDFGAHNYFVAHRRWILYPPQKVMGTGSVPPSTINSTYHWSANALWVILGFGDRPATPEWVAWPPEGYVPHPVVYARWSLSYPDADFSTAKVTMSRSGAPVSLTVLALDRNDMGYADNTIVWEPSGLPTDPPAVDITYTVTVSDVVVGETPRTFRYDVTIIDPDKPSPTIGVTDIKTLPGNAISITFVNTGTDASTYLLEKATGLSVPGSWSTDTNAQITDSGAGMLEAMTTCPPAEKTRFYRVKLVE